MMRRTIAMEERVCDFCGGTFLVYDTCRACGKDICGACTQRAPIKQRGKKGHAVAYNDRVFSSSSDDGTYCFVCDENLSADGTNALHNAYLDIADLRSEYEQWEQGFAARRKEAEEHLEQELKRHKRRVKAKGGT